MRTGFSSETLAAFEDAAASIVLRQIDRAFERAGIRLGASASEDGGARRMQFRRYVASVDQHDPQQRDRLGDALGSLIAEVAASKVDFLVTAAERDGFVFAGGVFRMADTTLAAFAITGVEDFASIDERGRRLRLLANDRPYEALAGATSLIESVCRAVSTRSAEPVVMSDGLVELASATLDSLDGISFQGGEAQRVTLVRMLAQLRAVVAHLSDVGVDLPSHHARLAIGVAVAFASFVAESSVAAPVVDDDP